MTRLDVAPAGMLQGMLQDSRQWVQVGTFQRVLQGMHRGLAFSQTPAWKAGTGTPERDDVAAGFEMENSKFRTMMVHEKLFYSIIA